MDRGTVARQNSMSFEDVPVSQRVKLELLRDVVERQGGYWFKVTTSSMEPALFPGDFVLVRVGRGRTFSVGEIVFFLSGAGYVVHRITKKRRVHRQMIYWQKGDTARFPEAIMESKILGHVIAVKRGAKTIDLGARGARVKNYFKVKYSNVKRSWHGDPANAHPFFANRLPLKIIFVLKNRAFVRKVLRFIRKNSFQLTQARPLHFFEIQRLFKLDRAVHVDPDCFMTVALKAGTVIGALIAQESESSDEWWINGLRVDRAYRGLGVGENLIHQIEQALQRRDVAYLRMWTRETNFPAINLYRKLGYRRLPEDPTTKNIDIVIFEKALNQGGV